VCLFIYGLFTDAVSSSDYVGQMARSLMNGELERTSKEAVEAYFRVESRQLPGQTQITKKTSAQLLGVPNEI
jgi:hypothetical protein